ncbi:hypothetical protein ILYODFUR_014355 [Ilyodon furcidens]|uniref:Uncharacterized protein n=1 Tax=Ilyodon furcidens TaxID=33524 RepID=A0ABV0URY1_9TELE
MEFQDIYRTENQKHMKTAIMFEILVPQRIQNEIIRKPKQNENEALKQVKHQQENNTRKQAVGNIQLSQENLKQTNSARLQQKQSPHKGREERGAQERGRCAR